MALSPEKDDPRDGVLDLKGSVPRHVSRPGSSGLAGHVSWNQMVRLLGTCSELPSWCYRLHYQRIWRQRSMRMNRQHSLVIVGLGRPLRNQLLTRTITDGSRAQLSADDILGGNPGGRPATVLADPSVMRTARQIAESGVDQGPDSGAEVEVRIGSYVRPANAASTCRTASHRLCG